MRKIFIPFILGLFGLSLMGCGASAGYYPDADKYVAGNQEYKEEITTLNIDWVSGNLTLVSDTTITGLSLSETTNITNEKGFVHSYLNEGVLKVKYTASGYHLPFNRKIVKDLEVRYNPIEVLLDELNVDLTSGKFVATDIAATDFSLDMTSGKSEIQSVNCKEMDVDITSGSLNITSLSADELDADLTSGSMDIIFVKECKASFDMTSGSLRTKLPEEGGTVKVSKTSGSVTTSRECTIEGNTYKFGNGNTEIKVSMTSGKLIID